MLNGMREMFLDVTFNNVLPDHTDVVVTVTAGLFMVESQGVEELMLDSFVVDATIAVQRHNLGITTAADVGPASAE